MTKRQAFLDNKRHQLELLEQTRINNIRTKKIDKINNLLPLLSISEMDIIINHVENKFKLKTNLNSF